MQLRGDFLENTAYSGLVPHSVFCNVRAVEVENGTLYSVCKGKVPVSCKIVHNLGHATDDHVLAKEIHGLVMQGLPQCPFVRKALLYEGHECLVSQSPEEFLEVHGKHPHVLFFRGNDNVLYVPLDGHEGTGFQIIKAPVLDKVLDCRAGAGKELYLIENDKAFPPVKPDVVESRQCGKKGIKVFEALVEEGFYCAASPVEVDEEEGFVLPLGKLKGNMGLAHASCTVDQ